MAMSTEAQPEKGGGRPSGGAWRRAIGTFLGACGGVVLATSALFKVMFPDASSWLTLGPVSFSLVSLALWLAFTYKKLTERLSERSGVFLLVTAGSSAAILALLAGAHYLLAQDPITWDLSAMKVHSLSEQSVKVVSGLKEPVRITAFYEKSQPELGKTDDLVEAYQRHTEKILYRRLSPTLDIEEAKRFEVTEGGPRVFVETQWDDPARRRVSRLSIDLKALNHEEELTNAIMKALQDERPKLYMLTGHGEADPTDTGPYGYKQAVNDLVGEGYDVVRLNLVVAEQVPDDARALLVVGPQQAFLPPEVSAVERYLARGGRAAIFLEAQKPHGLDSLLQSYGVQPNDDLVIDLSPFGSMFGGGPDTAIATDYAQHAITEKFSGAATVFPRSRSLSINPGTSASAVSLVRTGDRAWGETNVSGDGSLEWNEGEVRGPVTLAVASERRWEGADKRPDALRSDTRLFVVGDASFGANQFRGLSANRNLFLNAVGWLTDQEDKIAIRPKSRGSNLIILSPGQREGIAFFVLYGLPVALLSFGLGVWLVRRQR